MVELESKTYQVWSTLEFIVGVVGSSNSLLVELMESPLKPFRQVHHLSASNVVNTTTKGLVLFFLVWAHWEFPVELNLYVYPLWWREREVRLFLQYMAYLKAFTV